MTWASFILTIVGPVVAKILGFLGIAVVTFSGVDVAFSQLQSYAVSNYGGLPSAVIHMAGLAGVPQALGLVFGAFNARLSLWTFVAAKRFLFK